MQKDMPALRDEAGPVAGAFVRAHRGHVVAVDVDIAARDGDLAHDRLHQRGLADAVAAEDGRGLTRPDVEGDVPQDLALAIRSEEHTSELQSLMRISYAVFCLKKKKKQHKNEIEYRQSTQ